MAAAEWKYQPNILHAKSAAPYRSVLHVIKNFIFGLLLMEQRNLASSIPTLAS